MAKLSRRAFLKSSAALALATGCYREVRPASTAKFPLGVAAGDATTDGAVLWTRYAGKAPVRLSIAEEATGAMVQQLDVQVTSDSLLSAVSGLKPWTYYRYQFTDGSGEQSTIGRFRTAPGSDDMPVVRFGAGCCTKNGREFPSLTRAGEREDLDAFILAGDTVYADGATTNAEMRAKWTENFSTEGYSTLLPSTSLIATWDDHEIQNDWDGEDLPHEALLRGRKAFDDHIPYRRNTSNPFQLWRSLKYGRTAEVFVLDCRSERKPSTRSAAHAEYISPAQLDWLKAGLLNSRAMFKLIVNSVPISEFGGLFLFTKSDRWEGYAAQRRDLLSFLDYQRIPGVLFVSGDFHLGCVGRVSLEDPGSKQLEVLVGPSGNTANANPGYPSAPQWDWSGGTNNYTELELDPQSGKAKISFYSGEEKLLFGKSYDLSRKLIPGTEG